MHNIHIVNGPNLNLVGRRQPEIYGSKSFEDYLVEIRAKYLDLADISYYQSNHEGSLLDYIQNIGFEDVGIILNAGAYTHTSIALADCISAITAPVVEVHISDIRTREAFRQHSYLEPVCVRSIVGHGLAGYDMAVDGLLGERS